MTRYEPPLTHGGTLDAFARRFPAAPRPLIDLSTGINPVPYPVRPLPADALTRLPEPQDLVRLQHRAAALYGAADPAMVVAAPGTQLLISLLPRLLPQTAAAVLGPTYAEHAEAWRQAGATVLETDSPDALAGHGATVVCNPNNPDGRVLGHQALLALAARSRLLVVDEAFADLEPGVSLVPHLAQAPDAVVLRSFGKTFGLAGVRLGFAIAAPATARLIRRALGPWAVGGPALHAALDALGDHGWLKAAGERLQQDAARLDTLLHQAGCRPVGGTNLFRLVSTPQAKALAERLGRHGILVRRFADRPGLLRFGMPGPAAWDRLAEALRRDAGAATRTCQAAPDAPAPVCRPAPPDRSTGATSPAPAG